MASKIASRIAKEKKQQDIKFRWIEKAGVDDFLSYGDADTGGTPGGTERAFVEELRGRIDKIREVDNSLKEFGKKEKAEEKEQEKEQEQEQITRILSEFFLTDVRDLEDPASS